MGFRTLRVPFHLPTRLLIVDANLMKGRTISWTRHSSLYVESDLFLHQI
jgi:hypothetical protein